MSVCCHLPLSVMLGILAGMTFAEEPQPDRSAFKLATVDGETVSGSLRELNAETITIGDRKISAVDLLRIEPDRESVPSDTPEGPQIVLANGDRLHAKPLRLDGDFLLAEEPGRKTSPYRLPLETIRGIRLTSRVDATTEPQPTTEGDLLLLANGDTVIGEFLDWTADGIVLDTATGETTLPSSAVRQILFNPELVSFPAPEVLTYRVSLTNGSRITIRSASVEGHSLKTVPSYGGERSIDLDRIRSIIPHGGRAVSLTTLTPSETIFTPYLSLPPVMTLNRNIRGGPLVLDGRRYDTGLGLSSRTRVRYDLDENFTAFSGIVGIDDLTGDEGDVSLRILVDDRIAFERESVAGTQTAVTLPRIDCAGAKRLTIEIGFGQRGNIQDVVDLVDPILVRKAAAE